MHQDLRRIIFVSRGRCSESSALDAERRAGVAISAADRAKTSSYEVFGYEHGRRRPIEPSDRNTAVTPLLLISLRMPVKNLINTYQ